jgi:hypothetical protein
MIGYIKFQLAESARGYLSKCLKSGNTFAGHLLREVDIANGELFTFLPAEADQDCFNRYREGGLANSTESISHLAGRIRRFLNNSDRGMVIFEDSMAKKGDPYVAKLGTRMLFHGQEIYHYLLADNMHPEVVTWTITQASSPFLFICAMTTLPREQSLGEKSVEVSSATLKDLAKMSDELVVGAYDGEGFVYWKNEA